MCLAAAAAAVLAGWTDASSIPAFARKYKFSCSTCHEPFPRLKAFGAEFAGDGFTLKEKEKPSDFAKTGDDLLRLNKHFPLAVRFDAFSVIEPDAGVEADLQTPWGVKLLSGGALAENVGYYFYFYMSERGEVAGIEDAYIHFDDVFGSGVDVMAGQFQTSDPLMKRELRLTFEDYRLYKARPGLSSTDLTYDRGLMFLYGIEATGTDLAAMVVNGNGKGPASEEKGKVDDNPAKNAGFRLLQAVGGHVTVGGFWYRGEEPCPETPDWSSSLMYRGDNTVTFVGPDLGLAFGPAALTVQYLRRTDSNPAFDGATESATDGLIAELTVTPPDARARWAVTALYNRVESDLEGFERIHTATLNGSWLLARNLRLGAEVTRDLERDQYRFVVGVVGGM
jgi:hypothetical protein